MILILMGHAAAFLIGGPSMNSNYKEEVSFSARKFFMISESYVINIYIILVVNEATVDTHYNLEILSTDL